MNSVWIGQSTKFRIRIDGGGHERVLALIADAEATEGGCFRTLVNVYQVGRSGDPK